MKLTIGTMNSSLRNARFRTFFPLLQVEAVACLEKTIIISIGLGIPSSYFSNQRITLKLTIGTMTSNFRNAWFCTFFPFLQVETVACLDTNNNSFHRSRNTFKLLLKSKIKVEINHWDHEFQFTECPIPHFFSVAASWGSCVSGKNNNYIHRSRNTFKLLFKSKNNVEINHWDHDFQFPECLILHFFFRFCKLRQLRVWKKTIILSTVPGIPSSYFSNQRLKLKLTIGTMNSSFRNAWFRTFFPFRQVEAVECLEKKQKFYTPV